MTSRTIVLLHGLGEPWWSLEPLKYYLQYNGHEHVLNIHYPANSLRLDALVENVYNQINEATKQHDLPDQYVLVGQSMGGVVTNRLQEKNLNIAKSILVAAPLHGAQLLRTIDRYVPQVFGLWKRPSYDDLIDDLKPLEPNHETVTASFGWFWSSFDGCVFTDETTIKGVRHRHFNFSDHRVGFVDPRFMKWVLSEL